MSSFSKVKQVHKHERLSVRSFHGLDDVECVNEIFPEVGRGQKPEDVMRGSEREVERQAAGPGHRDLLSFVLR